MSRFKSVLQWSIQISLILGILSLVNFMGHRWNVSFDLSEQKIHRLDEKSQRILEEFPAELRFQIYGRAATLQNIRPVLARFQRTKKNLSIELIDLDRFPAKAAVAKINADGQGFAYYQGPEKETRKIPITALSELSLTNSLLAHLNRQSFEVYFLEGYDGPTVKDASAKGLSFLSHKLSEQGMKVHSLQLHEVKKIPSNAAAVFLVAPTQDLLSGEEEILQDYIKSGGQVFISTSAVLPNDPRSELLSFLSKANLKLRTDLVIDRLAPMTGGEASTAVVSQYNFESSLVSRHFSGRLVMPMSSSIDIGPSSENWLAKSSAYPATWSERNIQELSRTGRADFGGKDLKGPLPVAAFSEWGEGRLVLFSSSSFLINGMAKNSRNFEFFLSVLSNSLGHQGLKTLNDAKLGQERVFVSQTQQDLLFYMGVIVLPFLFFFWGVMNKRRRYVVV